MQTHIKMTQLQNGINIKARITPIPNPTNFLAFSQVFEQKLLV